MSNRQEFDQHAADYEAVLKKHTKIGGHETGYFAWSKVKLVHDIAGQDVNDIPPTIFDFGCGVGQSTGHFRDFFPRSKLIGGDVSLDSLALARQKYGQDAQFLHFNPGEPLPIPDNSVDIAFTACVLHHIPHSEHPTVFQEIRRILKPGGRFFIFEHNPLNPITVKIVSECPFDENAVLIKATKMTAEIEKAGFHAVRANYYLFFPGWLSWLRPVERLLNWLPLGAQYYVVGQKTS